MINFYKDKSGRVIVKNQIVSGSQLEHLIEAVKGNIPVKQVLDMKDITTESEKIGGKKCHRIWTPGIKWSYYSEPLKVKHYPTKMC